METICTKSTQYAARLLKKPDQCRAVCRASYMFWGSVGETPYRDGKRVLECLQRSLKIADACKVSNMHTVLFVEILDSYLYHFSQGNELVTADYVNKLLELIEQQLAGDPASTPAVQVGSSTYVVPHHMVPHHRLAHMQMWSHIRNRTSLPGLHTSILYLQPTTLHTPPCTRHPPAWRLEVGGR